MICPLASICPAISDGLALITRFSATEDADGWMKSTVCCDPTLKLCQLITARWLLCVIVVVLGLLLIVALPAFTAPPVGCAFGAGCARPGVASSSKLPACSAVRSSSAARVRPANLTAGCLSRGLRDPCAIRRSSASGGLASRRDLPPETRSGTAPVPASRTRPRTGAKRRYPSGIG